MTNSIHLAANDGMSTEAWLRIVRREALARQRRLIRAVGLRRPMAVVEQATEAS